MKHFKLVVILGIRSETSCEGEAQRSTLRKVRAGRPLAAKTSRSKIQKWCVTETVKLKIDRPVDRPVDATILKKEVANAALNTTLTQSQCKAVPFRYSSEPDDRPV